MEDQPDEIGGEDSTIPPPHKAWFLGAQRVPQVLPPSILYLTLPKLGVTFDKDLIS